MRRSGSVDAVGDHRETLDLVGGDIPLSGAECPPQACQAKRVIRRFCGTLLARRKRCAGLFFPDRRQRDLVLSEARSDG
jgi:hypothetical protein